MVLPCLKAESPPNSLVFCCDHKVSINCISVSDMASLSSLYTQSLGNFGLFSSSVGKRGGAGKTTNILVVGSLESASP